ncbi:HIT domain-containing protein [Candidatus Pacearchaeota archaeon]|nr:HIT domain-containing protein [Candidatus Pacearchaeota archaeon]
MDDCVFCKIVKGEISVEKIYEDEKYLAFLDAFPVMKGQVLIIPKEHISSYLFEMDDKNYSELLLVAKKVAKAMDNSLKPIKTGMVVEGLEVDHVHVKLFPLDGKSGFNLKPLEVKPSEEEMKEISDKIKKFLD